MTTELYILLKVKSRKGLGIVELIWLKVHKSPSRNKSDEALDNLWKGKFIQEESWEIDEQGRELIPSLPDKRFVLTENGRKRLKKLKLTYPLSLTGKVAMGLFLILKKVWIIIAALVAFFAGLLTILQSLESKGL